MFSTRLLIFLLATLLVFAQAKTPVTTEQLIQMQKLGMAEQMIIDAIRTNGSAVDTSVPGLIALKTAGLSDRVISAAQNANAPNSVDGGAAPNQTGVPDEIGVYLVRDGHPQLLPVEVVNARMGIPIPAMPMKLHGIVSGTKSSIQLSGSIELILHCADGTASSEYQLIPLEIKKDHREFTAARVGITGSKDGVNDIAITVKFEKIGRNTYRATVTNLKRGEYGILAPGALASSNGASAGKMYAFGVIE